MVGGGRNDEKECGRRTDIDDNAGSHVDVMYIRCKMVGLGVRFLAITESDSANERDNKSVFVGKRVKRLTGTR